MVHEVIIPVVDQTTESVRLAGWNVREGDAIKQGDIVCEIETEKATVEVEAPADGIVRKILVEQGTTIPPRTVVAIIGAAGDSIPDIDPFYRTSRPQLEPASAFLAAERKSASAKSAILAAPASKLIASPRARRLADEKGVNLSLITPSRPDGRIIEEDITDFLASTSITNSQRASQAKADRVSHSWKTIPHFYMTITADLSYILAAKKRGAGSVTLTDFFIVAIGRTLEDHPLFNGFWHNNGSVIISELRIGLVIQTERGLVVPTLQDTKGRPVEEIAVEREDIVRQAAAGRLHGDSMAPSTFTMSNVGAGHIDYFTAIINPPQLAIISIGSVLPRPVVVDSLLEVRPSASFTLGVDHRAIDGRQSALFLEDLKRHLEADTW